MLFQGGRSVEGWDAGAGFMLVAVLSLSRVRSKTAAWWIGGYYKKMPYCQDLPINLILDRSPAEA
jgi:hypothetical protein